MLDLHGLTRAEAESRLRSGLHTASVKTPGGLIHVITGKGRNSAGPPVLKQAVRTLLKSGALPWVADFGLDHDEGGYLVRLRR